MSVRPVETLEQPQVVAAVREAAARSELVELRSGDPQGWRDAAVMSAVSSAVRRGDDALVRGLAVGYGDLLRLTPCEVAGVVDLTSGGVAERRRRGAFATPAPLAAVLARHALVRIESGVPAPSVVDPACGPGALLAAAFDRLLALGVDPAQALAALHGVDADPAAVAVARAALVVRARAVGLACDPEDLVAHLVVGDALLGATPLRDGEGLIWHEAFPEVLGRSDAPAEPVTGWCGGFDAVVANPPWERWKVTRKDWAGAPPPHLRASRAAGARSLRESGRHPLTGAGELNAYLPFVETCWRLLAPTGRAGLLVPAGIASDRSSSALLQALLEAGALDQLHLLDPPEPIFDGVSRRVGVAVLVLGSGTQRSRPGHAAQVTVGVRNAARVDPEQSWPLDGATVRLVNPNTATAPLFATPRDAEIVTGVHRRLTVLRTRDADGAIRDDPWQVRLITPLHMTRDAKYFRTAPGPGLLPLWEAKHAGLLDHRGGGTAAHRYWVPQDMVQDRWGALLARGWLAGYRNVTTVDSPRTLVPTALPVAAVGNSLPLISAPRLPLLLAALASLPVDYVIRQKHAGANLNFFKLEQAVVPVPQAYDVPAPWWPSGTIGDWVLHRFARAVAWDESLVGLAAELTAAGIAVPDLDQGPATVLRRELAFADLDAVHAVLLGLSRAELGQALDSFVALRRRQERSHGRYVTAERVLTAFDALICR